MESVKQSWVGSVGVGTGSYEESQCGTNGWNQRFRKSVFKMHWPTIRHTIKNVMKLGWQPIVVSHVLGSVQQVRKYTYGKLTLVYEDESLNIRSARRFQNEHTMWNLKSITNNAIHQFHFLHRRALYQSGSWRV